MNTEKLLWDYLEANPEDTEAKLALVDLLYENDSKSLANALKWCAYNDFWPTNTRDDPYYRWWSDQVIGAKRRYAHRLPTGVYEIWHSITRGKRTATVRGCIVRLGQALDKLRVDSEVVTEEN